MDKITDFNLDAGIHGFILQLPLPAHLNNDFTYFLNQIDPVKDIDCLSEANYNKIVSYDSCRSLPAPCVVKALDLLLQWHKIDCIDKVVVILGKSYLVGCPTRTLFQLKGATVLLCDQYTKNIDRLLSIADIVVFGTGQEIVVDKDTLKEGCVVFDIGIRMKETEQGLKVCGDVNIESVGSPDHRPRPTDHSGARGHRTTDSRLHVGQLDALLRENAPNSVTGNNFKLRP